MGIALFVFYKSKPELLGPLQKNDQILPWFVAHEMPAGLAGIVIAGVFAAAMSSLDSSMHSICTAVSNDFVKRKEARLERQRSAQIRPRSCFLSGSSGHIDGLDYVSDRYRTHFRLPSRSYGIDRRPSSRVIPSRHIRQSGSKTARLDRLNLQSDSHFLL